LQWSRTLYQIQLRTTLLAVDETELAVDPRIRRRRRPGEEVRPIVVDVVHKEAAHRVREEVPELVLVDDGLPRLADTARRHEAARRQTAKDMSKRVVG
jgi:hypothetical protein